ncbi:Intermembrane transport protein PqiB [Usitatibacter rugosus]|uniref:Intermembrane transport protein PqiB n=1 Tax=Usitatibacter rugosus TaxID=2732067 RepID=A0A6M4GS12_9PROT|nr:MlaD family protein [Usitatibacter rugosus]QJR09855.1 Intermembrane transport protein PqiB [Usitatibacter rugosus]
MAEGTTNEPAIPSSESAIPRAVSKRGGPRTPQLVWIVPVLALLIGGWLAIEHFLNRGPDVTITFKSAEGIEPGKTRIRHKAVDIGIVKSVRLSEDGKSVVVSAEVDRQTASLFLVEDTKFWVVRPRIAGGQVSGLGTLLAGSYIGAEPGTSKSSKKEFVGLETPPVLVADQAGRIFTVRTDDLGSLDINSPIYFRGVVVGKVVSTEVPGHGEEVRVGIFVEAPYDKLVNDDTRFWNASGAELSLDSNGVRVQVQSLITVLLGGIAFETPTESVTRPEAAAKAEYWLFDNRTKAMAPRETVVEKFVVRFTKSVKGLQVGSPVDFRGITVGEVKRIDLDFESQQSRFLMLVEIDLYPERLRSRFRDPARAPLPNLTPQQRIGRFVDRGMRAQLKSSNLLTGALYVNLEFFPQAPKATVDFTKTPPEIPVMGGGPGELQDSVAAIAANLEKVPFDKIAADLRASMAALQTSLKNADAVMAKLSNEVAPELRMTLESARKTLGTAEQTLSSDSPIGGDLRGALDEVRRAADSVRQLTDYLERHPESLIRGKRTESK